MPTTLTLSNPNAKRILERRAPRPPAPVAPSARPTETRPGFKPTGSKPANRNRPKPRIVEALPDAPWWAVRRVIGNDSFHGPMIRHPSKESAVAEAKRLAAKHRGVQFCVLESIAVFVTEAPASEGVG